MECDVIGQDCPEGEQCVLWSRQSNGKWHGSTCVPVPRNPGGAWEPCTLDPMTLLADCGKGLLCVGLEGESGLCVPHCGGNPAEPTCADPQATCLIDSDGYPLICSVPCNPLTQDCPGGLSCMPDASQFECRLAPVGAGAVLDPCFKDDDCAAGLFCGEAAEVPGCVDPTGCCTAFCDTQDPSCPPELVGAACVPWPEVTVPIELNGVVGGCMLPP
jgi:hypothetical protein